MLIINKLLILIFGTWSCSLYVSSALTTTEPWHETSSVAGAGAIKRGAGEIKDKIKSANIS